jgi:hypothetical protein
VKKLVEVGKERSEEGRRETSEGFLQIWGRVCRRRERDRSAARANVRLPMWPFWASRSRVCERHGL